MNKKYKALFYLVPIYYEENESLSEVVIYGRNWLYEFLLHRAIEFHHLIIFMTSLFFNYEPSYPIKITGKDE